jgi:hypothetical protein
MLLTNINCKIYCLLGCGHFAGMAARTPLSFVHLHIVKGFSKSSVHYRNCYVYFIASHIAIVNRGQLNVGSKFYPQYGIASVSFPTSLWSLFPIKTQIRNCVNTGIIICLWNGFPFVLMWIDTVSVLHKSGDIRLNTGFLLKFWN